MNLTSAIRISPSSHEIEKSVYSLASKGRAINGIRRTEKMIAYAYNFGGVLAVVHWRVETAKRCMKTEKANSWEKKVG